MFHFYALNIKFNENFFNDKCCQIYPLFHYLVPMILWIVMKLRLRTFKIVKIIIRFISKLIFLKKQTFYVFLTFIDSIDYTKLDIDILHYFKNILKYSPWCGDNSVTNTTINVNVILLISKLFVNVLNKANHLYYIGLWGVVESIHTYTFLPVYFC